MTCTLDANADCDSVTTFAVVPPCPPIQDQDFNTTCVNHRIEDCTEYYT